MASYSATWTPGKKTLTSTTVDTITLSQATPYVDVHNLSGTADLIVTIARGATPTTPVAATADMYVIPQSKSRTIPVPSGTTSSTDVRVSVLGNGNDYLVEAVS